MFNKLIFLSALYIFVSGCTSLSPYKMEIRQGNYVAPEARQKIRVGMSRQQIISVLGSPLVSDVFHANRWDYIYRLEERSKLVEQQRLTLHFEGDFVKRIEDTWADAAKVDGDAGVAPAK
jgi:outer membrane protein assembly factor BamE